MPLLQVENVTKCYKQGERQVCALDGISLEVERGEFLAVIGSSGSGKTTLLNIMGGLDRPDEGKVIVNGYDLSVLNQEQLAVFRRSQIGFIFQSYNLIPSLTIRENIVFPLELGGQRGDQAFIGELTQILRLEDRLDFYPHQLSGGQQQRVAVARALASRPAVILADEPTGNLDSITGQNVAGLLKTAVETFHQTLIMITHNMELSTLADTVIRLEDGRIRGEKGSHAQK